MGNAALLLGNQGTTFKANDLVFYGQNSFGVALQVDSNRSAGIDFVRVLDESGQIKQVKSSEITKKVEARDQRNKVTGLDSNRNTLQLDTVVKVINGPYKGKRGVIKYIHKQTIFLWNRDFHQTNGLFVEKNSNIQILGGEHIINPAMPGGPQSNGAVASLNKVRRDPLQGKEVLITGGQWKGHRGKVASLDDK